MIGRDIINPPSHESPDAFGYSLEEECIDNFNSSIHFLKNQHHFALQTTGTELNTEDPIQNCNLFIKI